MKRVTGLGGVFFKCADPPATLSWYREHLGIDTADYGYAFTWHPLGEAHEVGYTVWSPHSSESSYFDPSKQPFMMNFRVHDLEALLAALESEGVTIVGEMQTEANGKFAWVLDPNGTKIELWQPVPSAEDPYLPDEVKGKASAP